jgi:hypothetical protein
MNSLSDIDCEETRRTIRRVLLDMERKKHQKIVCSLIGIILIQSAVILILALQ